ncbi:MAG: recombinase family protein [Sumerlaeia bacterium]
MASSKTSKAPTDGRVAYSYTRYSSGKQEVGSSEDRQIEKARDWAARKGVRLVEEFIDRKKPGFDGSNKRGELGRFLFDVKSGRIPSGSFLVIEAINRLTRENPYDAEQTVREVLDAGIILVILYREEIEVDQYKVRDPSNRVLDQMRRDIELAHFQSAEKSRMGFTNWKLKVAQIQARVPISSRCPGWLKVQGQKKRNERIIVPGKYVLHPERAKIVKEIIALRKADRRREPPKPVYGYTRIARELNKLGRKPFQAVYNGRPCTAWSDSSVKWILTHPALYGEYRFDRPVNGKTPPPVAGYYPPLMKRGEWLKLQSLSDKFRKTGGGRQIRETPNLFDGKIFCSRCKGAMHLVGEGPTDKYQYRRYRCHQYSRKAQITGLKTPGQACDNHFMPQQALVEGLVLFYLFREIDAQDLAPERPDTRPLEEQLDRLTSRRTELDDDIALGKRRLLKEKDDDKYDRLQGELSQAEAELADLRGRIRSVEAEISDLQQENSPQAELVRFQASQDALLAQDEASREQLRVAIHRVLHRVEVGVKPIPLMYCDDGRLVRLPGPSKGVPRYPVCTIYLNGGEHFRVTGYPPAAEWQEQVMGWPLPRVPRKYRHMEPGQFDELEDLDAVGMVDGPSVKPGWFQLEPEPKKKPRKKSAKKAKTPRKKASN